MEAERAPFRVEQPRCPWCHAEVHPGEAQLACNHCRSWHHRDCWREARRCAACGSTDTGLGEAAARTSAEADAAAADEAIDFACTRCAAPLEAPQSKAGSTVVCGECKEVVEVPPTSTDPPKAHELPLYAAGGAALIGLFVLAGAFALALLGNPAAEAWGAAKTWYWWTFLILYALFLLVGATEDPIAPDPRHRSRLVLGAVLSGALPLLIELRAPWLGGLPWPALLPWPYYALWLTTAPWRRPPDEPPASDAAPSPDG